MARANERRAVKRRAATLSMAVSSALAVLKVAFGLAMGSLSIIAASLDSLLDLFSSVINWVSIRKADQPADEDHPFGHGKFESIAGLIQVVVVIGAAVMVVIAAVERYKADRVPTHLGPGMALMLACAGVSLLVSRYIAAAARRTESPSLAANALQFSVDVWANLAVVVALGAVRITERGVFDPLAAGVVAVYLIISAVRAGAECVGQLLDQSLPPKTQEDIAGIIDSHYPRALGMHRLRTRQAGSHKIIDLHVVFCKQLTFEQAHELTEELETEIEDRLPGSDVLIHADPCEEECTLDGAICQHFMHLPPEEAERAVYVDALIENHWDFEKTARQLGIPAAELRSKATSLGIPV